MFDGILKEGNLTNEDCISVIGQTPKNAKISENADIVFLFQRYRFVFILDLSASETAKKMNHDLEGPIYLCCNSFHIKDKIKFKF